MQFRLLYFGFAALFFLFGCSSEQTENSSEAKAQTISIPDFSSVKTDDVFVYECGDSLQLTAYVKKDSTWLFLPDTSLKVSKVRSGSGAKYQGSNFLYWSKKEEALFQMPTGALMNCTSIPQERSWAAAKIRGVHFRALGQEPGWHLEISEGKQMKYIGNYGADTVLVPTPKPKKTDSGSTVYQTNTNAHSLTVKITDKRCTDAMSGFKFPSTVTVTIDGSTYHGCGRRLRP